MNDDQIFSALLKIANTNERSEKLAELCGEDDAQRIRIRAKLLEADGNAFALPEAVDGLDTIRRAGPSSATVTVCGTDPLNVTGSILAGQRTAARRTETVQLPV